MGSPEFQVNIMLIYNHKKTGYGLFFVAKSRKKWYACMAKLKNKPI